MKTFLDLIEEVQKPGYCHHCGGCVAFCTAINYGALELGDDGRPVYKDQSKCIECGLCYLICPEIGELDEEVKKMVSWGPPIGCVMGITVARAANPEVRARATYGGVVTALLVHLLNQGRIDGAILTKGVGPFERQPCLALTREEILEAANFYFDTSCSLKHFSDIFSTFSPPKLQLSHLVKGHLNRLAFVGTPCQINTLRRMEALGIVPAASIKFHLGLFCTGNFSLGPEQQQVLEEIGHFRWDEVRKVNVKEELLVYLQNGEVRHIPLDKLDFMKRYACQYCYDYSAEYADLSFGGLGAPEGWTTVIARTAVGNRILSLAKCLDLEQYSYRDNPRLGFQALAKVLKSSEKKKNQAALMHQKLEEKAGG